MCSEKMLVVYKGKVGGLYRYQEVKFCLEGFSLEEREVCYENRYFKSNVIGSIFELWNDDGEVKLGKNRKPVDYIVDTESIEKWDSLSRENILKEMRKVQAEEIVVKSLYPLQKAYAMGSVVQREKIAHYLVNYINQSIYENRKMNSPYNCLMRNVR